MRQSVRGGGAAGRAGARSGERGSGSRPAASAASAPPSAGRPPRPPRRWGPTSVAPIPAEVPRSSATPTTIPCAPPPRGDGRPERFAAEVRERSCRCGRGPDHPTQVWPWITWPVSTPAPVRVGGQEELRRESRLPGPVGLGPGPGRPAVPGQCGALPAAADRPQATPVSRQRRGRAVPRRLTAGQPSGDRREPRDQRRAAAPGRALRLNAVGERPRACPRPSTSPGQVPAPLGSVDEPVGRGYNQTISPFRS